VYINNDDEDFAARRARHRSPENTTFDLFRPAARRCRATRFSSDFPAFFPAEVSGSHVVSHDAARNSPEEEKEREAGRGSEERGERASDFLCVRRRPRTPRVSVPDVQKRRAEESEASSWRCVTEHDTSL